MCYFVSLVKLILISSFIFDSQIIVKSYTLIFEGLFYTFLNNLTNTLGNTLLTYVKIRNHSKSKLKKNDI